MRIVLVVDDQPVPVDVDPANRRVRIGDREFPYRSAEGANGRLEVEVDGERVVIDRWPAGLPDPPGPDVDVDGERVRLRVEERSAGARGEAAAPTPSSAPPAPATSPAHPEAIEPPMPGRVIEVRVREGDRVAAGAVLLVLEAMKMRNEVVSPRAGFVRDLKVAPGTNVRAHEPMLRVAAD